MTAHVSFTALKRWGEAVGLHAAGLTSQSAFLLALGILEKLRAMEGRRPVESYLDTVAVKQLIMPSGMGDTFKVLVQHKGVDAPARRSLHPPW